MRTPAGKECPYFYGDYYRGRKHEECRLLEPEGLPWSASQCSRCPVPDIVLANACEHMAFKPRLERPFFLGKPEVKVTTYCKKCECDVSEPRIGCGQCHPLPEFLVIDPDGPNPASRP